MKFRTYFLVDYRVVFQQHAQYVIETDGRLVQVGQIVRSLQEHSDGHEEIDDGLAFAGIPFGRALQVVEQGAQRFCRRHVDFVVSQCFLTKLKIVHKFRTYTGH